MKISPINNLTRRALPLATAAALGLGALTACSSSREDNQKLSYVQTEMKKLDDTLANIKANRGEGDEAFMDYYVNSRDAIINAPFDSDNTPLANSAAKALMAGFGIIGCGLIGMGVSLKNTGNKLLKSSFVLTLTGAALSLGSEAALFINRAKMDEPKKVYNEYRNYKLNELQTEKQQYFDTKDLEFTK